MARSGCGDEDAFGMDGRWSSGRRVSQSIDRNEVVEAAVGEFDFGGRWTTERNKG